MQITIKIINNAPPAEQAPEPRESGQTQTTPVIELTVDEWKRRQQAQSQAA